MLLALLAILATSAAAAPPDTPEQWARVETHAIRSFRVGWWTGFGGTAIQIGGLALRDDRVALAGGLSHKTGVGLMLASSTRHRRAILAQGGSVSAAWCIAGWTLWASGGALDLATPWIQSHLEPNGATSAATGLSIGALGLAVGGHVLAISQHRHNLMASTHPGRAHVSPVLRQWTIRPAVSRGLIGGLLDGRF